MIIFAVKITCLYLHIQINLLYGTKINKIISNCNAMKYNLNFKKYLYAAFLYSKRPPI